MCAVLQAGLRPQPCLSTPPLHERQSSYNSSGQLGAVVVGLEGNKQSKVSGMTLWAVEWGGTLACETTLLRGLMGPTVHVGHGRAILEESVDKNVIASYVLCGHHIADFAFISNSLCGHYTTDSAFTNHMICRPGMTTIGPHGVSDPPSPSVNKVDRSLQWHMALHPCSMMTPFLVMHPSYGVYPHICTLSASEPALDGSLCYGSTALTHVLLWWCGF
jgi:hypothetical protein